MCFGRRGKDGSGRYLRVYDKALESDGERNCIRWEVEFSKLKAREVVFRLATCSTVEELAGLCGALVGGSIDFVERTERVGDKNLERLNRLEWWDRIVALLGRVRLANKRRIKSVEKCVAWIETSVAASLGMLRTAYGAADFDAWLSGVVESGEFKLTARQEAIVEAFHRQGGWTRISEAERVSAAY